VTSEELFKAIEKRIERTLMRTVSYSSVILYSEHFQEVMYFKLRLLSSASFMSQKKLRFVIKQDYFWWNQIVAWSCTPIIHP
jgi:hypothetical protein